MERGYTTNGKILKVGPLVVQLGLYGSMCIRVGYNEPDIYRKNGDVLKHIVETVITYQKDKGAVYLAVREMYLANRKNDIDVQWLHENEFKYHHYRPGPPSEFVYVADLQSMVPQYATSIEGVKGVVVSPDKKEVFVVWERGCWSPPGGAVNLGEMKITALQREIREETGILIDIKNVLYLGGYQQARARDKQINDNFSTFLVTAQSKEFEVDGKEIQTARWVNIDDLLEAYNNFKKSGVNEDKIVTLTMNQEDFKISRELINGIQRWKHRQYMPCLISEEKVKIGSHAV